MRALFAISALSFAGFAVAQDATITVGAALTAQGGPLQFTPPSINATKGSTITFMFTGSPGNHTVTQSSFAAPCQPLQGGFDSGYIFIPGNTTTGFPSWNLTIEDDSKPIWFYCAQLLPVPHCTAGMVGGINVPDTGNTYQIFKQAAIATNGTLPGTPVPALNGTGAAASVAPGPLSGSITGFALPTGTAPAASGSVTSSTPSSSSSAPPTGSSSAAESSKVNGFVLTVAALFGVALL